MAQSFFQTMHSRKLYLPDLASTWSMIICFVFVILAYWLVFIPVTVYEFSNDIDVKPESKIIHKMIPDAWTNMICEREVVQRTVFAKFNLDNALNIQLGQHAWIRMTYSNKKKSFAIPCTVVDVRKSKNQHNKALVTLRAEYLSAHADPFKNAIKGEAKIEVKRIPLFVYRP